MCMINGAATIRGNTVLYMHILGAYLYMCARYEVSIIKPVARRAVHR